MPLPVAKRLGSQGDEREKRADDSLSTAPVEGMNDRIKAMKRPSRWLRDLELKVQISATHETRNALVE